MSALLELITSWETYTAKEKNAGVEDFCRYYLSGKIKTYKKQAGGAKDLQLAIALGKVNSLHKVLCRIALKEMMPDMELEYYFLLHGINTRKETRKSDLLSYNLALEPTTSIDILNRMIRAGLLKETVDASDKRARLLSLTAKAKTSLSKIDALMEKVSTLFFSGVSAEEKQTVQFLFNKLDSLNKRLVIDNRHKNFSEISVIATGKKS